MIQAIALIVIFTFTMVVVLMAAGPMYEAITDVVANDAAVQSMGHADEVMAIQETALEQLAPIAILLFVAYGFVWILRRERFEGRRPP